MADKHYFRFLWFAFLISSVGDWLQKIAIPILIFQKTGSAYQMAGLYGISFVPWVLFTMFGGVLADRLKKSKIISFGYLLSLIFAVFLIIEVQQNTLNLPLIYLATFLLSSVEPLTHPAFQSLIPQLTDKNHLERANAQIGGVDNTLSLIGPMIGG
ncbi:MAG: MFS transporter, partial [Streptococcaceae bacterium]|nr:MFS transporter [Streptococcaceae bacterium]